MGGSRVVSVLSQSKGEFKQTIGAIYKVRDWLYAGVEGWHEAEYADWRNFEDSLIYLGPSFKIKSKSDWSFVLASGTQLTNVATEADFVTRFIFEVEF
jgi:hypothetical protein